MSYEHIYNAIKEAIKKEEKNDTNILHLLNRSYDENSHSTMICRLLNVLPYRKKFFEIFGISYCEGGYFETEICIDSNRRMDIYLKTDTTILCIENKIYAGDQSKQLSDYWEFLQGQNTKQKYIIYLTLEGNQPSAYSMPTSEWEKLQKQDKAHQLSYEDIITWLKKCTPLKTGITENEIQFLTQYKDNVEHLLSGSKHNEEFKKLILKEFKSKQINNQDDWDTLYTVFSDSPLEIRTRLHTIIKMIRRETAERLIQNTSCPQGFNGYTNSGFEFYSSIYAIKNSKYAPMNLQLIYRYNNGLSPFYPYIGLYHIPKKHLSPLREIISKVLEKKEYPLNSKESTPYLYFYVEYDKDHKKLLVTLDKAILNYFENEGKALKK